MFKTRITPIRILLTALWVLLLVLPVTPLSAALSFDTTILTVEKGSALYGNSLCTGDFNGDGYGDIAAGAPRWSTTVNDTFYHWCGLVRVNYGSAYGIEEGDSEEFYLTEELIGLGHRMASGDIDNDGFDDLVVGAFLPDSQHNAVYIYYGSQEGLSNSPARLDYHLNGDQDNSYCHFGFSLACGDLNGDGCADVIVGAPAYDNGDTDEGAVLVYYGSSFRIAGGAFESVLLDINDGENACFGYSLAYGDLNNDGFGDLIAGSNIYKGSAYSLKGTGEIHVFWGSQTYVSSGSQAIITCSTNLAQLGRYLTTGDINNDGLIDLLAFWEKKVYIFLGGNGSFNSDSTPNYIITNSHSFTKTTFGLAMACSDVNADGVSDLIVGDYQYGLDTAYNGAVHVYPGPITASVSSPDYSYAGISGSQLGSVIAAGNTDYAAGNEFAAGAIRYDLPDTDVGAVYVFSLPLSVIPGDVNHDGKVNAQDITGIERIVVGLDDPPTDGADANQDGEINSLDVTKIEKLAAKLE